MSNHLHIYAASAGSGKTYTIAREYLKLALAHKGNYRYIQAVTFTNKATEEMKERILGELYKLSCGTESELSAYLQKKLKITPQMLRQRAETCLRALLLDYGSFRISTIDTFFQEILRSFARDLNLSGSFRLEMEAGNLLDEACLAILVDRNEGQEQSKILSWVRSVSLERLNSHKGYNPLKAVKYLSRELLRDEVQLLDLPSIEQVQELKDYCDAVINDFCTEGVQIADRIFDHCRRAIDIGCCYSSALSPLLKLKAGSLDFKTYNTLLTSTLLKAIDKPESIFKQTSNGEDLKGYNRQALPLLDMELVRDCLLAFRSLVSERLPLLLDALSLRHCLPSFGLLTAIDAKVKELQKDNNCILLSNTSSLINLVLREEGGVPFLYERIGTRIRHYMIDEFQDTSLVQYQNFLPLLENSLAEQEEGLGQDSIIVGDVKQSIYRFRGADSRQLSDLEHSPSPVFEVETHSLESNWRSTRAIVAFNNQLYEQLSKHIAQYYQKMLALLPGDKAEHRVLKGLVDIFTRAYSHLKQEAKQGEQGQVVLHRFLYDRGRVSDPNLCADANGDHADTLDYQIPQLIRELRRRGYKSSDIALLVRTRTEANQLARILQCAEVMYGESFDFVSDDALSPNEAVSVDFVIALLECIVNPEDTDKQKLLGSMYGQVIGCAMPQEEWAYLREMGYKGLYETIEGLVARYQDYFDEGEVAHLIKLLDTALSFEKDLSMDLKDFLNLWEKQAKDLRLALPPDEHKLQITTIHKSKGLAFGVVLLPYLLWELIPEGGAKEQILWCDNPFAEHTGIDTVPVALSSQLLGTSFAPYYIRECMMTSLDALNLLYVATTRAKYEMHLWLPREKDLPASLIARLELNGEKLIPKRLPALLLELLPCLEVITRSSDAREVALHKLQEVQKSVECEQTTTLKLRKLVSYDIGGRIEELKVGLDYFKPERRRNFGIVMHQILSELDTLADLPYVQRRILAQGDFLPEERGAVLQELERLLDDPMVRSWFDGSGQHLNEQAIITHSAQTYRPDRIVLYPDGSAVVLDYKFGKLKPEHERQITHYAQLLVRMGYSPVKPYLWYLSGTIYPIVPIFAVK